jgi:ABC-type multidrug transport system fused ATPase/permease subunit
MDEMKSKPDKMLNQLVVAALTIFLVVVVLFAAFVLRHLWLQQQVAELSSDVQVNLENLEEVTGEIERELTEIQETTGETQNAENWEEIAEVLDDVDEQLDLLGDDLNEVAEALDSQAEPIELSVEANAPVSEDQRRALQDQIDQVFTILAILVALASIAIAILLAMALWVQQKAT